MLSVNPSIFIHCSFASSCTFSFLKLTLQSSIDGCTKKIQHNPMYIHIHYHHHGSYKCEGQCKPFFTVRISSCCSTFFFAQFSFSLLNEKQKKTQWMWKTEFLSCVCSTCIGAISLRADFKCKRNFLEKFLHNSDEWHKWTFL